MKEQAEAMKLLPMFEEIVEEFRNKAYAYPMMIAYTAFGGLSGFAQTASMVKETGFSMLPYLKMKLLCTAISFGLSLLLI